MPHKPPTTEEQEIITELGERVRAVFKFEAISNATTSALSGVSHVRINELKKGGGSVLSMIRIMRVLGYDIAFVKAKKKATFDDNIDAVNRLVKHKKNRQNAYRKTKSKHPTQRELKQREDQSRYGGFLSTGE